MNSPFNYTHLISMFASKTEINKILKIYYRVHQAVYSEYHKSYEELLQINEDISIHQKHLRILEVCKSIKYFKTEFMCHFSNTNSVSYNLRKGSRLFIPLAKSVNFVRKLITFRRSLLLNDLPLKLKNSQTIKDF